MLRPLSLVALVLLAAGCSPDGSGADAPDRDAPGAPGTAPPTEQPAYRLDALLPGMLSGRRVTGTLGGRTYTLLDLDAGAPADAFPEGPPPEGRFALIDTVAHLDGDGVLDALVSTSDGGNCCGPTFHVVSLHADGTFTASRGFEMGWGENYRIVADPSGPVLTFEDDGTRTRLAYRDGAVAPLDRAGVAPLTAVREVTYDALQAGTLPEVGTANGSPVYALTVDLDGDNQEDHLACRAWERWGAVVCTPQRANGTPFMDDELPACHRLGVLATRTGGMADLVCDEQNVLRWDGRAYAGTESSD